MLIGVGGLAGNVVRIQPPLIISDDRLERAINVIDDALTQIERA